MGPMRTTPSDSPSWLSELERSCGSGIKTSQFRHTSLVEGIPPLLLSHVGTNLASDLGSRVCRGEVEGFMDPNQVLDPLFSAF